MPRKKKPRERWEPLEIAVPEDTKEDVYTETKTEIYHEVWMNRLYTVLVRKIPSHVDGTPPMIHLSIRRNDRGVSIDWRHKQYIKNQICGEDCEGVEIFPAESRLVDASNQFHLWVFPPGQALPFGYGDRLVYAGGKSQLGAKQRPFERGLTPDDALTTEQMNQAVDGVFPLIVDAVEREQGKEDAL